MSDFTDQRCFNKNMPQTGARSTARRPGWLGAAVREAKTLISWLTLAGHRDGRRPVRGVVPIQYFRMLLVSSSLLATGVCAELAAPKQVTGGAGGALARTTSLSCLTEASATVEVGTLRFGALDTVLVQPGDIVRKGQVLAVLDSRVERAAVLLAERKVNGYGDHRMVARSSADRGGKNAVLSAAPTHTKQRASASAELEHARRELAQRTITSPLAGVVVDRLASVEEQVAIIKIAKIDPLRVQVVMPGELFASVKAGMAARVVPELQGTPPQMATVDKVDAAIDAASNTFRAQLTLPNSDLGLPAGVRCKVVEFASQSTVNVAQTVIAGMAPDDISTPASPHR